MSNDQISINVDSVCKQFNSLLAVDHISFDIEAGEIFGLLGPNGAGKTTLIRLIMDIIRPDSGIIKVFGHPLSAQDKDHIGYLPEERGLYTKQKVLVVLEYFGQLKGLTHSAAHANAIQWLEKLEVAEYKNRKIQELSKGNQQKIQIIATIIADPKIVILDEPFAGLDPVNSRLIINLIKELANNGKIILLSTHQMSMVETLCQRVFMINKGQRVLYGTLKEIKQQYADNSFIVQSTADYGQCSLVSAYASLGSAIKLYLAKDVRPHDFLSWLVETGAEIESFEKTATPLEDIFVKVVEDNK